MMEKGIKGLKNLIIIVLGTLMALHLLGGSPYSLSAFQVNTRLSFTSQNQTSLIVKPIGQLRANTHKAPLSFHISLEEIHLSILEEDFPGQNPQTFLTELLQNELPNILYSFFLRLLLVGAIGGGIALYLWSRDKRLLLDGILIALIITSSLLLLVYFTYDVKAFHEPELLGILEEAPWVMGLVEEGLKNIHRLGEQVRVITQNLGEIYQRLNELESIDTLMGDKIILHVSDIHNNPVAFHLIEEMVNLFQIDLIIDTGDLTDYGTALEAEIAASIACLPVPYVFIPGNHDSPAVISYLLDLKNVIILEGETWEFEGISITGLKDPAATSRGINTPSSKALKEDQERLKTLIQEGEVPQIVAVHSLDLAAPLIGQVPLILHGHTHSMELYQREGTIIVDAGTTGAAGIRGLERKEEVPYSLALLHFKLEEGARLMGVDLLQLKSQGDGFQLERVILDP